MYTLYAHITNTYCYSKYPKNKKTKLEFNNNLTEMDNSGVESGMLCGQLLGEFVVEGVLSEAGSDTLEHRYHVRQLLDTVHLLLQILSCHQNISLKHGSQHPSYNKFIRNGTSVSYEYVMANSNLHKNVLKCRPEAAEHSLKLCSHKHL